MRLDLSGDQEFFQETTRRFIETSAPVAARRGGESWVLNGAKMWTTQADKAEPDDPHGYDPGRQWLTARQISNAGTNEMQRNIISERLLGMRGEAASDRDIPFSELVHRPSRP